MTFVSKGMAQKSGKSHLCNVKCRKFWWRARRPGVYEAAIVISVHIWDRKTGHTVISVLGPASF